DGTGVYVLTTTQSPLDGDTGLGGPLYSKVVKLNATSGAQIWTTQGGFLYGPVLPVSAGLLVGGWNTGELGGPSSHGVVAFDKSTGATLGAFTTQVMTRGNGMNVAAAPDGKLYLGGYFHFVNGVPRSSLARLNVDGTV